MAQWFAEYSARYAQTGTVYLNSLIITQPTNAVHLPRARETTYTNT